MDVLWFFVRSNENSDTHFVIEDRSRANWRDDVANDVIDIEMHFDSLFLRRKGGQTADVERQLGGQTFFVFAISSQQSCSVQEGVGRLNTQQ